MFVFVKLFTRLEIPEKLISFVKSGRAPVVYQFWGQALSMKFWGNVVVDFWLMFC